MERLVPVIDHVLESIALGQIVVTDTKGMRETLLLLRSLALEEAGAEVDSPLPVTGK